MPDTRTNNGAFSLGSRESRCLTIVRDCLPSVIQLPWTWTRLTRVGYPPRACTACTWRSSVTCDAKRRSIQLTGKPQYNTECIPFAKVSLRIQGRRGMRNDWCGTRLKNSPPKGAQQKRVRRSAQPFVLNVARTGFEPVLAARGAGV